MAYDERLAERVRSLLNGRDDVDERRMFGGLTFLVGGNMCCGVHGDELILRLGPEGAGAALRRPHVRPMDMTGRPLTGWVMVAPAGVAGAELGLWVERATAFASSLPRREAKA